jgi:signal transduction histidine kinase
MPNLAQMSIRPSHPPMPSAAEKNEHTSLVRKLESLSLLSGGVAHDFNNLLMAILGNAELAMSVLDDSSADLQSYIQEIQRASGRAADLCRRLLAFAGRGRFISSIIELKPLIAHLVPALEQVAGQGILLQCDLPEGLPAIKGNSEELRHLLKQLIRNAGEAVEQAGSGRPIALRLSVTDGCDPDLDTTIGAIPQESARYVVIEIADEGEGMDARTRLRMFDPFFTTRGAGRGLGLASVFGAVRGHGGLISVASQPGAGTQIRLYFPALDEHGSASSAAHGFC